MKRIMINNLNKYMNEKVNIKGWVHRVRKLKSITFLILRDRTGLVQCVIENNLIDINLLKLESVVSITGNVKESNNKLNPYEISAENIEIINSCMEELPIELKQNNLEINLETMLNNRVLA
jgi:nondiscriminating aspartyl-tRNA synthetase